MDLEFFVAEVYGVQLIVGRQVLDPLNLVVLGSPGPVRAWLWGDFLVEKSKRLNFSLI